MSRLPRQLEGLARMLAYMLCHRPDEFGLVLSDDGFISLKHLLRALASEPGWAFVRRHHLEEVAMLSEPRAFEVQGEAIRGLIPGPARLRRPLAAPPPALLYLAISPKAQERVWEQGLTAPPGQELVLAATPDLALKLGKRRSPEPILITIQAQAAAKTGLAFQGYGEQLYLAASLPREFLQMPAPVQSREKAKPEKPVKPQPELGSLSFDLLRSFQEAAKPKGKRGEPAWKSGARALRKKRRTER